MRSLRRSSLSVPHEALLSSADECVVRDAIRALQLSNIREISPFSTASLPNPVKETLNRRQACLFETLACIVVTSDV